MTTQPRLTVTINEAKEEIIFNIERGIDSYSGSYDKTAANTHDGEIINSGTFMRVLKAATIKRRDYVISFSPDNGKAFIDIELSAICVDEELVDKLRIICAHDEYDESRTEERKLRVKCCELRESIEYLRAEFELERAINIFQSKWGTIRACERELVIELLKHPEICLPAVGCEWIQLGNKYFECCNTGMKINNIVCCMAPQNRGGSMPNIYTTTIASGIHQSSCVSNGAILYVSFFARIAKAQIDKMVNAMRPAATSSRVAIGFVPNKSRYIAIAKDLASPPSYTSMTVDDPKYFGFHLDGFNQYYNNKDDAANRRDPIQEEFAAAQDATEYLAVIAEKSGMIPYKTHKIWNIGTIPEDLPLSCTFDVSF